MLAALSAVVPLAIVLAEVVWMVLADAQPAYDDMGGLVHRSVPYRCAVAATTGFALLLRYLPLRRRLGPADWRFCACPLSVVGEQAPGIMWREFSECRHTCLVSNIFTDFIRVYARPDSRINEVEAQWITWMLLGPRGSYHVPACIRCGPQGRYAEIQYGSGKSDGLGDFCDNYIGWRYGAIWVRHFNEGGSQDVIWHAGVDDGPRRSRALRYAHDGPVAPGPGGPASAHADHPEHRRRGIDEYRPALARRSHRRRVDCHVDRVSVARTGCALGVVPVRGAIPRSRPRLAAPMRRRPASS
jgi:hypothetical protein